MIQNVWASCIGIQEIFLKATEIVYDKILEPIIINLQVSDTVQKESSNDSDYET